MISPHIFKTKKHIIFCNFDYQKFVNIFGNIHSHYIFCKRITWTVSCTVTCHHPMKNQILFAEGKASLLKKTLCFSHFMENIFYDWLNFCLAFLSKFKV